MVGEVQTLYGFRRLSMKDTTIRTKAQGIAAILDRLVEAAALQEQQRDQILSELMKRETLGSTAIGGGVAIPHAKSSAVTKMVGAIAEFPSGLEFESIDGKPVYLVCLFVSPVDQPGEHLRVLERVARRLRQA
jgi:mannitol/fructose-specific phosphotransferase system IIA component (Ntr-type)